MSQASSITTTKRPPRMGHGPGRMMMGEKPKDLKGGVKKLAAYLAPFKFKILLVVLCAALGTVFTIVSPKVLAKATDELARGMMAMINGAG